MNPTTLTFPTRNMAGQGWFTLVQGKNYSQNQLGNRSSQLSMWRSMSILHMLYATPVHWHCKRELTVETATFGSEFVAARTAVDQIIDLSLTLLYLGVPINPNMSYMVEDNKAVVTNATIPTSTLRRDPILLPTTDFEKQLQWASSSSIGRMENPILQISLASIGDL